VSGYVYYVTTAESGRVKIGFTRNNPAQRMKELETGSPFELCVIACEPGSERDERDLHNRFFRDRLHGEWFTLSPELKEHIREVNRAEMARADAEERTPDRWVRIFDALERGCTPEEADCA
jgi:hypothetical protein